VPWIDEPAPTRSSAAERAIVPVTFVVAGTWATVRSAASQDHDRRCWALLRKPLEDQGRVTMLSTCSRSGYRRRRGPKYQELAACTAHRGNYDISTIIGTPSSRWGRGLSRRAVLEPARRRVTRLEVAARPGQRRSSWAAPPAPRPPDHRPPARQGSRGEPGAPGRPRTPTNHDKINKLTRCPAQSRTVDPGSGRAVAEDIPTIRNPASDPRVQSLGPSPSRLEALHPQAMRTARTATSSVRSAPLPMTRSTRAWGPSSGRCWRILASSVAMSSSMSAARVSTRPSV